MKIIYRKTQKKDYQEIKKLIIQAWFSEYVFSNTIKNAYAEAYLRLYLAESNYQVVACNNEKVIAFLFGRYKKVSFIIKYCNLFLLFLIKFSFLFSKPGRRKNKILRITKNVNKNLHKKYKNYLINELSLFIVDKNYQEQGIGSNLESDFSNYLRAKKENHIYLFCDTYSNYQFYEKRKYKRGGEIEVNFGIKGEEEDPLPRYFLYYKKL